MEALGSGLAESGANALVSAFAFGLVAISPHCSGALAGCSASSEGGASGTPAAIDRFWLAEFVAVVWAASGRAAFARGSEAVLKTGVDQAIVNKVMASAANNVSGAATLLQSSKFALRGEAAGHSCAAFVGRQAQFFRFARCSCQDRQRPL